jgi:hypothetical protein
LDAGTTRRQGSCNTTLHPTYRHQSSPSRSIPPGCPRPADPDYWPPADRDFILTLDDLLVEEGRIAPFSPTETSYAAMGRFGNVFLTSGDPDLHLEARVGEVVRLWLTNTANTRVFNVMLPGARMKAGWRRQRPL